MSRSESGQDFSESLISVNLNEDDKFEAICSELSNKNARRILSEVIRGNSTSTSIREVTGLTIQYIIRHLYKLQELGFIESDGKEFNALRGRSPTRYRAKKVGALLVSIPFVSSKLKIEVESQKLKKFASKTLAYLIGISVWVAVFQRSVLNSQRSGFDTANPPAPLAPTQGNAHYLLTYIHPSYQIGALSVVFCICVILAIVCWSRS